MPENADGKFVRSALPILREFRSRLAPLLLCFFIAFAAAEAKKKPPSAPVDLNTATPAQLEELPGIGPAAAQAIVNFRTKSGRFQRVEDLLAIRGISQRKLDALRPYVRVSAPSSAPQAPKKNLGFGAPKRPVPDGDSCD
jgi:competence ComEA-like helix-hairpin-helix protein